jgi:hypothetical protein
MMAFHTSILVLLNVSVMQRFGFSFFIISENAMPIKRSYSSKALLRS